MRMIYRCLLGRYRWEGQTEHHNRAIEIRDGTQEISMDRKDLRGGLEASAYVTETELSEAGMRIEPRRLSDQRRLIILFILILAEPGLSLNSSGNRNPAAVASKRSPAASQGTLQEKNLAADDHSAFCEDDKARMQNGLRDVFRNFQQSDSPKTIEVLVDIDYRIRALLERRPRYRPCADDSGIYEPLWENIGVNLGYSVELAYSGLLLEKAHRAKPNSSLRRFTLFSTIFGTKPYNGLGVMPDIKAAFTYASEFPDGPFAKETFRVIADFHKDLFMVLRDNQSDYKYDCYKSYITKSPIQAQKQQARRIALAYYGKALEIDPTNEDLRALSNDVDSETVKVWSFCAD